MRHHKAGRKLGRESSHRVSMLRNMVASFFEDERIETTDAKAKELRKVAEKMITLGKHGSLHARRNAFGVIRNKKVVKKLFDDIAPRFQDRQGGYTRIFKAGHRSGDGALLSLIELTSKASPADKGKKKKKEKTPTSEKVSKKKRPTKKSALQEDKGEKESKKKDTQKGKEPK